MVCVAPISCQDLSSHPFCLLSGAWPHARPTTGAPATRGLAEHPHLQHPPLPPPPQAYLSHPAFYSPIPHPGMLYQYMAAHPYPPPAPAPAPETPSRKRAGPEETQSSRSKRKRSNGRDAIESERCLMYCRMYRPHVLSILANGSRRGYTTNKRNQAAQIAAQNGMLYPGSSALHCADFGLCYWPSFSVIAQLQAYTPGSGPSTNDSRASATDRERLMRSCRDSIVSDAGICREFTSGQ